MRRVTVTALFLSLLASVAGADPADLASLANGEAEIVDDETLEARKRAAQRYLAVVTPISMMEEVSLTTFRGLPPVRAHELAKQFVQELHMDVLEQAMVDAIAKNFTNAEIDALTGFYSSPHGRSAMLKMNAYMADLLPAMQSEMHRALAIVRKRGRHQPLAAPAMDRE